MFQRKVQDLLQASANEQAEYESFVAENLCSYAVKMDACEGFNVKASAYSWQEFTVARFATAGGRGEVSRSNAEIRRDKSSRYIFYVPLSGTLQIQQLGRESTYDAGSIGFFSTSETISCKKLGDNDTLYFLAPRDFVDQRLTRSEDICGRVISPSDGLRHLIIETLRALHVGCAGMSPSAFGDASRCVADLILSALKSSADLTSTATPVRAANLARAKRIIRKRCSDPDLTLTDIAQECGYSLRYLHNLFREDGYTVREYLITERLEHARRLLTSPARATTKITEIYLASGFSNHSHFSKAFRRSFACSPRDVLLGRV